MSRKKHPARIRLNLAISEEVLHRLQRLVRETEAPSMSEVIRRALLFYEREVRRPPGVRRAQTRPSSPASS